MNHYKKIYAPNMSPLNTMIVASQSYVEYVPHLLKYYWQWYLHDIYLCHVYMIIWSL